VNTGATDRLFFAVYPDAAAAAALLERAEALRVRHGLRGRSFAPSRLHVTLHFVGDHAGLPAALVETACASASSVRAPAFDIGVDRAASFVRRPRNRPFVLLVAEAQSAGVRRLQAALGDAMQHAGLGRHVDTRFTPHLTLMYDDAAVEPEPVDPVSWTVREFRLMHSRIGRGQHEVLARWPLERAGAGAGETMQ